MTPLPPELIEQIIDLLRDDTASLCASTLACRALAATSRRHLFHAISIHSVERAAQLRDLAASSKDLTSLICTVSLVGHWEKPRDSEGSPPPHLVNVPRINILLSTLPRLENASVLELSRFAWNSEAEGAELLLAKFSPFCVKKLRLHRVRFQTFRGLTMIASVFSSLAIFVGDEMSFTSRYQAPESLRDVEAPPSTLHTIELRIRRYRPNNISWRSSHSLAQWLSKHRAPELIHTLTYIGGEYDPGPPLVCMLHAWGPVGLRHLRLEITAHTDSSERQHTLRALSKCTKLETLALTYVVFNKETPNLSGLIELLAHLSSPSLSTVTISVRAEPHWPVSLPDYCYVGKPEILQFAELCLPSWAGVVPLLTKSRWPGTKRIVIRACGDEAALRDFLQTCCPALLQVFILEAI